MDLAILAAELNELDYALLDDSAAAAALNLRDIATPSPVNRVAIKALKQLTMTVPIYLTTDGVTPSGAANLWHVIKDKAAAGVIPMSILWDLFQDDDFQSIDFVSFQAGMLDAGLANLVADATLLFSEADKTALTAQIMGLVEVNYSSIAEGLGLGTVTEVDVNRARYAYGD